MGKFYLMTAFLSGAAGLLALSFVKKRNLATVLIGLSFFTSLLSLLSLVFYLILNDYSLVYVRNHSSNSLQFIYKISAAWAGQEGSLLLWAVIFVGVIFIFRLNCPERRGETATLLLFYVYLLVMIFMYYDPFLKAHSIVADGAGLNPVLKSPFMVIHPPLLFIGYSLAAVPFAFGIVYMATCKRGDSLVLPVRWGFLSLAFTGAGIALGAYWAYSVLGWGGYWGWDPVENSSLVSWLLIAAYLHCVLLNNKSGGFSFVTVTLSTAAFFSVVYGSFLTRSGLLADFSVHSFGKSVSMVPFLIPVIVILLTYIVLSFLRIKHFLNCRKEPSMDLTSFVLLYFLTGTVAYAVIIAAGTSMPVISEMLGQALAVGKNYYQFASSIAAIYFSLLITTGLTHDYWAGRKRGISVAIAVLAFIGIISLLSLFFLIRTKYISNDLSILHYIIVCLSFFMVYLSLVMVVAKIGNLRYVFLHLALPVFLIGAICSESRSFLIEFKPGIKANIEGTNVTFEGYSDNGMNLEFTANNNRKKTYSSAFFSDPIRYTEYKEPVIIHSFLKDIYISPEGFISGYEAYGRRKISIGDESQFEGLKIILKNVIVDRTEGNDMQVRAVLEVISSEAEETVETSLLYTGNEALEVPGTVMSTGQRIFLRNIDPDTSEGLIWIEPMNFDGKEDDVLTARVSIKSLVILVWFSMFIAISSLFISSFKKRT